MTDVLIYHQGTKGLVRVPAQSVVHYRMAGWQTYDEFQESEALRLQREAERNAAEAEASASSKSAPAGKSAGGDAKKE